MNPATKIDEIVDYWFGTPATTSSELETKIKRWYLGGTAEDAQLRERFGAEIERALAGALDAWADTMRGRMALILLLDQMTRSVFRGSARSFDGDPKAQRLATEALDAKLEQGLVFEHRQFLLMPLLHAESLPLLARFAIEVQRHIDAAPEWARPLLSAGTEQAGKYRDVIARFGRFPHRNEALGRVSTPEELEFLEDWSARAKPKVALELEKKG